MTSPNAPLLKQTNRIKDNLSKKVLTATQQAALEQIQQYRDDNERYINLHGPTGAGKTVLCWVLQATADWEYTPRPTESPNHIAVILDNGSPEREATRRVRNLADLHSLTNVLYVTEQPAAELYPRIELPATEEHREAIENSMRTLTKEDSE